MKGPVSPILSGNFVNFCLQIARVEMDFNLKVIGSRGMTFNFQKHPSGRELWPANSPRHTANRCCIHLISTA